MADQGKQAKLVRRKSGDNTRILRSSQKNKKIMQAEGVLNFWEICYELIIRTQLSRKLASGDEDLDESQFLIPNFLKNNKLGNNKAMRVFGLMESDQPVTSKVSSVRGTNSIVGIPAMGNPRTDGILKLKSTPPNGIDTPDNLTSVLEAEITKSQRILPARDENPKSSTFLRKTTCEDTKKFPNHDSHPKVESLSLNQSPVNQSSRLVEMHVPAMYVDTSDPMPMTFNLPDKQNPPNTHQRNPKATFATIPPAEIS